MIAMKKKWLVICSAVLLAGAFIYVANNSQILGKTRRTRPARRFILSQSWAQRAYARVTARKQAAKRLAAATAAAANDPMLTQADFTSRINALIGQTRVDVSVLDTQTGRQLTFQNGGSNFWQASSIKAAILTMLVEDDGPLSGNLDKTAQAMIRFSDNDAATSLFYRVGGFRALMAFWAKLGMTGTVANYSGFGLSSTTAADQIKLLQYIKKMPAVDQAYILNVMAGIVPGQRFGIGTMPDPAFKNGWLNNAQDRWYVNSIGFADKERYLVAILTENNLDQASGQQLTSRIADSILKK
ncbi:Beta-lactamase class A [Oenococcus kitaharae DSM 17330]|uniref:Beta-lactamase class A n=2 Tax=Oenococcus kitaharae TaxID=336988 RepID=G9WIR5_9LACO|nr:Beta-lactamase class A [Oenococcus kitaharae DSM 17330]